MTATTPEDIQISLGQLGSKTNEAVTSDTVSLSAGTGVLYVASGTADNGKVAAPAHDWDWSNIADISDYYNLGKMMPASSATGAEVYFTPDADGVGKTIKEGAAFIRADNGANGTGAADGNTAAGATNATYKTTLHAITAAEKGATAWTATGASAYDVTNDDGYYVDIPVWLRTSSATGQDVSVMAYVKPRNAEQMANTSNEALYRAVRVAVLSPTSQASGGAEVTATNLLPVADGWTLKTDSAAGKLNDHPFSGTSILNWYNSTSALSSGSTTNVVAAKTSAAASASTRYDTGVYGVATAYAGTKFVTLAAPASGANYGVPSQVIVRVWLEGEDPDCWNETAGQDWSINLKFVKGAVTDAGNDDINGSAPAAATP